MNAIFKGYEAKQLLTQAELTIGKTYQAFSFDNQDNTFKVADDVGDALWVYARNFKMPFKYHAMSVLQTLGLQRRPHD